jgi:hypothetical protein
MARYRYLIITLAAFLSTLVVYATAAVNLVQTDTFVTHSSNISQIISTYRFANLRDINADILFFGDSTAIVGVDPDIVEDVTGLPAYNLSLTVGSFIAVGDTLLQNYLKQNRPPKVIVLYIGPWTTPTRPDAMVLDNAFYLQYPSWEATFAVINFASMRDIIDYFARFPGQLKSLLRWSVTQLWRGFESGPAKRARIVGALDDHQGWIPLESGIAGVETFPAIPDGCRYRPWELAPDTTFIANFRKRYESPSTKVLVFVSPIPDCDESIVYLTEAYRGIADRLPSTLPHRYFAHDTPRHNHLLEAGCEANSEAIGVLLKDFLRQTSPYSTTGGPAPQVPRL